MLVRWVLTVDSEMNSSAAISWLPSPRATAWATSSSRSESGWSIGRVAAAGRDEPVEVAHRDRRRDQRVTDGGGAHRLEQQLRTAVFEDEAGGAVAQRDLDVLVGVEGRGDDDSQRRLHVGAGEEPGGGEAVEHGHPDVEQADIGPDPLGQFDGRTTVVGLADNGHVGLAVDDHPEAGPHHRLIVGEQHGDRVLGSIEAHREWHDQSGVGRAPSTASSPTAPACERAAQRVDPFAHADQPVAGVDGGVQHPVGDRELERRGRCCPS